MISALAAATTAVVADVPVEPGADEAREWMIGELSKAPYQAAQPTWFDRVSQAVADWFSSLRVPDGSGFGGLIPLIGVVIVVVVLVVVFLVYGRPRLNRRSRVEIGGLFGTDDTRSAAELRASAARAAAAGDFTVAVEEAFRGLARGLTERTIVTTSPGTTAQDFSRRAATSFPGARGELADGAGLFDGVRYLDRSADRADYDRIVLLDRRLQAERPVALEAVPGELVR
ncbi:DUF4129 domain-containing protein [Herbiconiux sp. CPCC 205716]|uniref:DUF4129 domain-containing protein n=1 Tax=Herbiconiux gentiana TaxID=2970912 RepID=A0ABT2GJC8_9MICO|nr:DUF4129 domain-containing protein [Herbiconiux gentiana]MCS5716334.1 DUF4129 domain-containing protein [Herbiconiux gentiana]